MIARPNLLIPLPIDIWQSNCCRFWARETDVRGRPAHFHGEAVSIAI